MNSLSLDQVVDRIRSSRVAILAGAGISVAPPTCLPLAGKLVRSIVSALFEGLPPDTLSLDGRNAFFSTRPETLYQVLSDNFPEAFPETVAVFSRHRPNACHHAISELLRHGLVRTVLTTNFDLEIEHALADPGGVKVVSTPRDLEAVRSDSFAGVPLLAKIHGDISSPGELVGTVRAVASAVEGAGIEFLRSVTSMSDIWVIGYSGADFDVLPALAATPNRLIWNVLPGDEPPILSRLISARGEQFYTTTGTAEENLIAVAASFGISVPRNSTDCSDIDSEKSALISEVIASIDIVRRMNAIGEFLFNRGNLADSKAVWKAAVSKRQELSERTEANILTNLSAACARLGEFEEGLGYLQRAIAKKEQLQDVAGLASAYQAHGNYLLELKSYPEALAAYCRSIQLKKQSWAGSDLATGISHSLHGVGRVLRELGEEKVAQTIYENAQGKRPHGTEPDSVQTFKSIAFAHLHLALNALDEAVKLADQYGETAERATADALRQEINRLINEGSPPTLTSTDVPN